MDNNYLIHYGIMGMKWGVRRYQNPDGTLTPAGRRRQAKREANQRHPSEDYIKTATTRKKHYSELTNQELQEVNKRLNLEKNYKELTKKKSKGKKAVDAFVKTAGTVAAVSAAAATYEKVGKKAIVKLEDYVVKDVAKGLSKPLM